MLGCDTLRKPQWYHTAGKSNTMNRHHPFDDRPWKRGAHDFGQGSFRVLPDHKRQFNRDRMRELGFTLFQDFTIEPDEDYPMRWWFQNTEAWKSRIERIEQMGYKATSELQVT